MNFKFQTITFLLFLIITFSFASNANQVPGAWAVKDLVEAPTEIIALKDKRGKTLKKIHVDQMVYLYAVMTGLEEVTEINATLILLEGKEPNAFAAVIEANDNPVAGDVVDLDGNVVGLTFGMLDLIKLDVNSMAAIIGHELAHLKLKHGEESENARKTYPDNVFSAAGTKYSRDNEREADYLGIIWAIEAGYDPIGAVNIHEKLYKLSKRKPGGFSGSHPSSIERLTVLKSLVRRLSR